MKGITAVFGEANSLRRSLVRNILAAIVLCILIASFTLIHEFYEHLADNREEALAREAQEIAAQIVADAPDLGLDADALRFRGGGGIFRYTVFDEQGRALVGGEEAGGLPERIAGLTPGGVAFFAPGEAREAVVMVTENAGRRFAILVSTSVRNVADKELSELLHEIKEELHWVALSIAAILLAAILAAHRALRTLGKVSEEAREIGPGTTDMRLSTAQLPSEMVPLVGAVNEAFDRLEQGYRAQREFSSNVAHEVRTPLAVLRSSIDRIGDDALRDSLRRDIHMLEQIFEQLIDLSRAEALGVTAFEEVDLHSVAVELAQETGVAAMREGKRLAVTGADKALCRGHRGLLQIALGNLLRNAINYSPADTEIEIEVTAAPPGWFVRDRGPGIPDDQKAVLFQRFRRGATRGRAGSGIGLAIVKSVADAHGATVSVRDRDGGGSEFRFEIHAD